MNLKYLQSLNQSDLKLAIGEIVEKRIFRLPPRFKRCLKYIRPRCFYIVERKGELVCVWNGNYRRKTDICFNKSMATGQRIIVKPVDRISKAHSEVNRQSAGVSCERIENEQN